MIGPEEQAAVHLGRREAAGNRTRADAAGGARAEAFAGLVDRRALDAAYRYATLMLGDRAEAEDATHDAALAAWRRFGELRDPDRFDAWFGRILVNACRDRMRRRRRVLRAVEVPRDHADGGDTDPDATLAAAGAYPDPGDAVARREEISAALRALSPEHREVVVLRFYADLSVGQIADRTGVGAGTVKSRIHYALRHLRGAIGEQDGEGSR
jgi:RNA polymerase sigma-70 factor (ECF subfamily)